MGTGYVGPFRDHLWDYFGTIFGIWDHFGSILGLPWPTLHRGYDLRPSNPAPLELP